VAVPDRYHEVRMNGRKLRAGVYRRHELPAGVKLQTPCIVTEYSATTLVPADAQAAVDNHGIILISLKE
jgi:N-methylhydantoinase A/oxoprolinase/acetone carboxylase beta subunit